MSVFFNAANRLRLKIPFKTIVPFGDRHGALTAVIFRGCASVLLLQPLLLIGHGDVRAWGSIEIVLPCFFIQLHLVKTPNFRAFLSLRLKEFNGTTLATVRVIYECVTMRLLYSFLALGNPFRVVSVATFFSWDISHPMTFLHLRLIHSPPLDLVDANVCIQLASGVALLPEDLVTSWFRPCWLGHGRMTMWILLVASFISLVTIFDVHHVLVLA